MFTKEDPFTGRITYGRTGIANLSAARKYLRDKFGKAPLEPIQVKPGHRFYVSARRGGHTVMLLGPYVSHMTALYHVPRGLSLIRRVSFVSVGTCSSAKTLPTRFGR